MNFDLIRLSFLSPLHISNGGNYYDRGDDFLHSDTLYSAIIQQLANIEPSLAANPKGFNFSSAFPFTKNDKGFSYFFPKPYFPIIKKAEGINGLSKKLKKLKWIEKSYFEKLLAKDSFQDLNFQHIQKEYLSSEKINESFIKKEVQLRIGLPADKEDTDVYYIEKTFFAKDSGLFLLAQFETEEIKTAIKNAFDLLQLNGIGTDRSVGMGHFEITWDSIEIDVPTAEYMTNLSLFIPEDQNQLNQLFDENSAYDLILRGGWLTDREYTGFRKNMVYMIREAGLFKKPNGEFTSGRTVDLQPNKLPNGPMKHPVWRLGRSIFLPIKL